MWSHTRILKRTPTVRNVEAPRRERKVAGMPRARCPRPRASRDVVEGGSTVTPGAGPSGARQSIAYLPGLAGLATAPPLSSLSTFASSAFTSASVARMAPVGGDIVPVRAPELV